MNGAESYPESSRSLDSLREMRLTALLGDLIEEQGKGQAAETLGVSARTLGRFEESRRLTPLLTGALERHLLEGGGSAAATQRHRAAELEDRVRELEAALVDGLETLRREGQEEAEAQAGVLAELRQRVAALEAAENGRASATAGVGPGAAKQATAAPATVSRLRRDYPELVTADAEPGEEPVYGQAATAVIVRWREARGRWESAKDQVAKLEARERRLEAEIELVETHRLTLPPATYPWDQFDRRDQLHRRRVSLDDVQAERSRARLRLRLRRVLTLGLWRK